MITAAQLDAMVAAGATLEMVVAVVKAGLPEVKTRTTAAERQARYRERKASQAVTQ